MQASAKVNPHRICSPYPESGSWYFQNLMGNFLVQRYFYDKIFIKIRSVFLEKWAKLWKNAISRNVEELFEKFLDQETEVDDFNVSTPLVSKLISIDTDFLKSMSIKNLYIPKTYFVITLIWCTFHLTPNVAV